MGSLCFVLVALSVGQYERTDGVIQGVVLNATEGDAPMAGLEVVLRVRIEGQFASVDSTTTDASGRYAFTGLPVGTGEPYLAGANCDGVHFPGPRLELTAERPRASVPLRVFEAQREPNPLVIESLEIEVHAGAESLRVTEKMIVANPVSRCFVGKPHRDGTPAPTLQLSIPPDFDRITFDREFFGRQFFVLDDRLVTTIPWEPGRREIRYTYLVANQDRHQVWRRPLDLPCARVRLTVETESPEDVVCNLESTAPLPTGQLVFESSGDLSSGHVLELELGRRPLPTRVYLRIAAVLTLVGLICGAGLAVKRRRSRLSERPGRPVSTEAGNPPRTSRRRSPVRSRSTGRV